MAKPETVRPAIAHGHTADTFPKLLLAHAQQRGARPAMREKDLGIWQTWTWQQTKEEIEAFARLVGTTPRTYFRLGYGFTRQRNGATAMHAALSIASMIRRLQPSS